MEEKLSAKWMLLDMDCGRRRNRVDLIPIVNGSDSKC